MTTVSFVLPAAARVIFTVNEVSPVCVGMGRFRVAGHGGVNRIRFAGRIQGHPLSAGTYRISVRTVRGRIVRRITLVVVDGPAPSKAELRSLQAADACGHSEPPTGSQALSTSGTSSSAPPVKRETGLPANAPKVASGFGSPGAPSLHPGGVLGSSVEETARAIQPLLVAMLAAAIVLLGLASLPRAALVEPKFGDLLARYRVGVAALGAGVLVAGVLALLLE